MNIYFSGQEAKRFHPIFILYINNNDDKKIY